ncbi:LLM class flavin-dependent oxidoreductase [Agromyces soli]
MTRVGAVFSPYPNPPETFRAAVEAADEAGLDELWVWEDCFRQGAFAQASAALAWTERLHVGIGIAPMPLRNAAVAAMEIATVERLFPGRLLPGVGHGVLPWMGQVGARVASPLTLLREYVPALRGLLAGDELNVEGRYVSLDRVRLDWPPAAAPAVYAAAEGPKTLQATGEVADGTVLTSGYSAADVATAVRTVREARAAAGRPGEHDVVAYVLASFGRGSDERVRAELEAGGAAASARGAAAPWNERSVFGDAAGVAEGVERYAEAGVDSVVLLPPDGEPDLIAFYADAAEVGRLLAGRA